MEVINRFSNVDGIVAAAGGERSALVFSFHKHSSDVDRARWKDLFNHLVEMLDAEPDEDEMRLVLERATLLLRRGGKVYVGAVVEKGHPAVKSLQRMVRRALKSLGAPTVRTDPRPPERAVAPSIPAPANLPPPATDPTPGSGDLGPSF